MCHYTVDTKNFTKKTYISILISEFKNVILNIKVKSTNLYWEKYEIVRENA